MSYLDHVSYKGVCSNAENCDEEKCFHKNEHDHHVWGSKHAGGPWSCVLHKHDCPYQQTDDLVICNQV